LKSIRSIITARMRISVEDIPEQFVRTTALPEYSVRSCPGTKLISFSIELPPEDIEMILRSLGLLCVPQEE